MDDSSETLSSPRQNFPLSSPTTCRCENQLAHWNWKGVPHPNLPEKCQRMLGSPVQSETICSSLRGNNSYTFVQGFVSTPKSDDGSDGSVTSDSDTGDNSATSDSGSGDNSMTSDSDSGSDDSTTAKSDNGSDVNMTKSGIDSEWQKGDHNWHKNVLTYLLVIVIAKRARRKPSNQGQGGSANGKTQGDMVNIFIEGEVCRNGRKRKYEGRSGGEACKRSKVSRLLHIASYRLTFCKNITCIRIEFHEPSMKISIQIGGK